MKSMTIRGEKAKKVLLDVMFTITLLASLASPSIIFADEIPHFDDGNILKMQNKSLITKKRYNTFYYRFNNFNNTWSRRWMDSG